MTYNPPPWATKADVPSQRWKGSSIIDPNLTDEERLRHLNEVYYWNGYRADQDAPCPPLPDMSHSDEVDTEFGGDGDDLFKGCSLADERLHREPFPLGFARDQLQIAAPVFLELHLGVHHRPTVEAGQLS